VAGLQSITLICKQQFRFLQEGAASSGSGLTEEQLEHYLPNVVHESEKSGLNGADLTPVLTHGTLNGSLNGFSWNN